MLKGNTYFSKQRTYAIDGYMATLLYQKCWSDELQKMTANVTKLFRKMYLHLLTGMSYNQVFTVPLLQRVTFKYMHMFTLCCQLTTATLQRKTSTMNRYND